MTDRTSSASRLSLELATPAATGCLGVALADVLRPGDVLALQGDLGTGKTALCRAYIRAAVGDPAEEVPSPTFTLVQVYDTPGWAIWHYDLYRLEQPEDAYELDIEDAFEEGVALIEWPDRLGRLLPRRAIHLTLIQTGETSRRVEVEAQPHLLSRLSAAFAAAQAAAK
ncbi:tRNA (adenosine(37)-N6)-threonylcarbamoyltransferase complex ATPase subunit type 1 TsaE [Insolitispirillum peregrinum]|uniref:tRNA (adenosine(37)-N6)-threonylcarbamoyltransferase complex ATPase subunit type 1 TsaE n=1 Tax=Insolitispirillum peregrinum TaxID=80876 RepID=UPI00360D4C01